MSGSRPEHFIHLIPILIETVKHIKKSKPEFKALLSISPFINQSIISDVKSKHDLSDFIISHAPSIDLMAIATFIVTIPGTNTAEIAYLGKPMLLIVPLNRPELLQFDGLLGLLGNLPIIGKVIKKLIIYFITRKNDFIQKRIS